MLLCVCVCVWKVHPLSKRKEHGCFCKKWGHMNSIQKSRHKKEVEVQGSSVVRGKRGFVSERLKWLSLEGTRDER